VEPRVIDQEVFAHWKVDNWFHNQLIVCDFYDVPAGEDWRAVQVDSATAALASFARMWECDRRVVM